MQWEKVKLGETCEVVAGQSPPSDTYNMEGIGLPFFQGKTDFGLIYPKIRMYCNNPAKVAEPNDILLSVRAPVGPTNIANIKCCIGRGLAAIRSNGKTYPEYLFYFFKNIEPKLSNQGNGSTFAAITTGDVKSIEIPLPPLPIQRAIANRLDRADALRQKDRQLLQAYDALAQAVFGEMFGGKQFERLKGKNLIKIIGGNAFKSGDYSDGGIPLIRIGAINKGYFDFESLVYLPVTFKSNFTGYLLYPGDLLITLTGTIGKDDYGNVFILDGRFDEYFLNQRVAKLLIDPRLTKPYVFHLFKQDEIKRELTGISRGVRQANISNEDIYNMKIPLPPLPLQTKFANILANIEQQKELVRKQQAESEALFGRLLQEAFEA